MGLRGPTPKQLGTGTPGSGNFLRGDGAWSVIESLTQQVRWTSILQPPVLSATENDYNPAQLALASSLKLTPAGGGTTITGIAGGANGRFLLLRNISGSSSITLTAEDVGSAAANRFSQAHIVRAGQEVLIQYDGGLNRWVPVLASDDYLAIHNNVAGEINAVATKGTPVNADVLLIEDSAASFAKKKITVGSLPGGGGTRRDSTRFVVNGKPQVVTKIDGAWIAPQAGTITRVTLYRRTAGSSGSTTVDVNKNGTTIFTTQGNRPSVTAASGNDQISARTNMDVTTIAQNDRIEVDIDAVEAGNPQDLSVIFVVQYT